MPSNVFISHSSKDRAIADAICKDLESAGIKCWIAPRDIEPGSDRTKGIMRGLAGCRVLVLVFTAHANDSEHVGREVAKAFSLGLAVIPFRVEAMNPRENLGYFFETVQWLDATTSPWQKHLRSLTERVKQLLANAAESGTSAPEKKAQQAVDPVEAKAVDFCTRPRWRSRCDSRSSLALHLGES